MVKTQKLVCGLLCISIVLAILIACFWYRALDPLTLAGGAHEVPDPQRAGVEPSAPPGEGEFVAGSPPESRAVGAHRSALARDEMFHDVDSTVIERYLSVLDRIWSNEAEAFAERLMLDVARSDPESGVFVYQAFGDPARAAQVHEDLWRLCYQSFGPDRAEDAFRKLVGQEVGSRRLRGPFGGFGAHDMRIEFGSDGEGSGIVRVYASDGEGRYYVTAHDGWRAPWLDGDESEGIDGYDPIAERPWMHWRLGDRFGLSDDGFMRLLRGHD